MQQTIWPQAVFLLAILPGVAFMGLIGRADTTGYRLPSEQRQEVLDEYKFPKDPQQPIIEMDLRGGLRAPTPPDFKRLPVLQVYADGRIVCNSQAPNRPAKVGKLTREQLNELLDSLVKDNSLFQIKKEQLKRELEGYRSLLADGLTTTIKVQLADRTHEISVYALTLTAQDLPDAPGIQALAKIEQRLRHVKLLGEIGSQEVLDSLLEAANQHLAAELPDANPWTLEHLRRTERVAPSGIKATLSRAKLIGGDGYNLSLDLQRSSEAEDWKFDLKLL